MFTIHRRFQSGFSLVEIAIVLVIVGLLLGGGLSVLGAQADQQRIKDTNQLLNDAREALLGYAASHADPSGRPYLPCPDTNNDGNEDRVVATGACTARQGNFPWVTLGLGEADSWGDRLRYDVTPAFSNSLTGMTLGPPATAGDITIRNAAGVQLAIAVPAVLISHGKNGFGASNTAGGANLAPTGANEIINANPALTVVSNQPVGVGGTGGEFDDLVTWLPAGVLFNRMIQAGRLP